MVNRYFLFILILLFIPGKFFAQLPDTITVTVSDTTKGVRALRTAEAKPVKASETFSMRPAETWTMDEPISILSPRFSNEVMQHHPYYSFGKKPLVKPSSEKRTAPQGKELLFYVMILLLLIFGFLRMAFPKYFGDLFRLFFRTTLKQRQIREQLIQTPLPSLLLNGFFVVSAGLYLGFVLRHFGFDPVGNFWLLFMYCCLGLSIAYLVKFIGLKISGWLFNMKEAANSYIFIVFIVNKMIGIFLLPFLVIVAFAQGNLYTIGLTVSWCMIAGMLIYRFILTYSAVRNQVRVNPFHFFLYLLAFEIAPLLLVYKGLLFYFSQTA